jgi:hypothetical protein
MSNKPSRFRRKDRTDRLSFPVDPDDYEQIAPAQREQESAQSAVELAVKAAENVVDEDDRGKLDAALATARERLEKAKTAYEQALVGHPVVTFTLRAMSGAALQGVQTDHPPTDEQVEAVQKSDGPDARPDYNPETYPPALLAAATVKVEWSDGDTQEGLTQADARDFWETSSYGDQQMIMARIGLLNQVPSRVEALTKG